MKRLATAALLLAIALPACDDRDGTSSTAPDAVSHPTGASDLIVRIATGGGLIPDEVRAGEIPSLSLYGDGRLIATGPQIEIYPQPALPNLSQQKLSEDGIQAILRTAEDAGLLASDRRLSASSATDLWTTTLTINADGQSHTTYVYGLGFTPPEGAPPPPQGAEEVAHIQRFVTRAGDLSWLPADDVGAQEPYEMTAMHVYAFPYAPDPDLPQEPKVWPLDTPIKDFETSSVLPAGCRAVSGTDLDKLLPLAKAANQLTPWRSSGKEHRLVLRPVLPDESDC